MQNVNDLIIAYNNRLIQMKDTLNNSLPGSLFVYHNTYDLVSDMVHNPSTYGKNKSSLTIRCKGKLP